MMIRKMLREIRSNFGQFLSLFVLAILATFMFSCFRSSNLGAYKALDALNENTNVADGWIYGESFDQDALNKIVNIDEIKEAQLRTCLKGKTVDFNQAQVDLYLENENIVSKPYVIEGEEFNPNDTEHVWISNEFAKAWDIQLNDAFTFSYDGVEITKTIAGFINSSEYVYMIADDDVDVNFKNITYVYMSYDAFPVKECMEHLIKTGKITMDDINDNSSVLSALGIPNSYISKDLLLMGFHMLSDEDIKDMMPYTQIVFTSDVEDVLSLEDKIKDALNGEYAVFIDQSSVAGITVFQDELAQHDQFAYIFSVIFVLIAVLVIMTTMSRMVEKQRVQIGTLNALGYATWKIRLHYMSYSFVISLLGSIVGFLFGVYIAGNAFNDIFKTMYTVPGWTSTYDLPCVLMIFVITLCCTFSSYFSCRKLLKVHPSVALRPAAPKSGKSCIFEKMPFWDRLGFYSQYNLRDISRAKLRAFMGVFGTACGMLILVAGIACTTTMTNISSWAFDKLYNYSYSVSFNEDISLQQADEFADTYDGELVMMDSIEISKEKEATSDSKKVTTLTVTEGKNIYGITDVDQNNIEIEKGTVAITSKLAKSMDISVGDTIYWHIYTENTWYDTKVGCINRTPNGVGITMLRSDFEKTDNKFEPSILYTEKDPSVLKENDYVSSIHDLSDIQQAFDATMEMVWMMIYVCIACAIILIIVVLYNSGNLSFNERIKELATLKVMGFESKQIRRLLSLQNLWLSMIGIVLGAPFGRMVLQWMFDSNGDSFDYPCSASFKDYFISFIIVLGVSVSVSFMFSKRIKKIDMVEVLKGIE